MDMKFNFWVSHVTIFMLKNFNKLKPKITLGTNGIPSILLYDFFLIFLYKMVYFPLFTNHVEFSRNINQTSFALSVIFLGSRDFFMNDFFKHVWKWIFAEQYGFIRNRYTIPNLFCINQFIANGFDNQAQMDILSSDKLIYWKTEDSNQIVVRIYVVI